MLTKKLGPGCKILILAKTHHSVILRSMTICEQHKDDANNGDNKDFKGNSGKRKRDDSYNAVESLETLKPNRTQSFTALLKEIRPYHGEQYTSSSSIISKNVSNGSSCRCLVLIFSDEEHTEVAFQCCQPHFQWKSTIDQLLNFKIKFVGLKTFLCLNRL